MLEKSKNHILILSDLHLGSPNCRADSILKVLSKEDFNILILNGDIIDSDRLGRLKKSHWKVLSKLRKLSKGKRILYIKGNHDYEISETISELLGLELLDNVLITHKHRKYYFTHGAEFDLFITKKPILTEIACFLYYNLQKLDWTRGKLSNFVKYSAKNYLKNAIALRDSAIQYAKKHDYDFICVGHSHRPECHDNFLNTGSFTEESCTYGIITEDAEIKLKFAKEI